MIFMINLPSGSELRHFGQWQLEDLALGGQPLGRHCAPGADALMGVDGLMGVERKDPAAMMVTSYDG